MANKTTDGEWAGIFWMVTKVRKGGACKTDPDSFIHSTITEYLISHIQILNVITGKPANNYF